MTPRTLQSPARLAALTARFWSRVDRSGGPDACWPWTGPRSPKGYGVATLDGESGAHRIAFALEHDGVPDGAHVCHDCDNPPCCNPRHLYAGSPVTNARDAKVRGRNAHAERNGSAKLTREDARAIREAFAVGIGKTALAERFGVTETLVHYVVIGRIWRVAGGPIAPHEHGQRSTYACSACGVKGHNRRSCTAKEAA